MINKKEDSDIPAVEAGASEEKKKPRRRARRRKAKKATSSGDAVAQAPAKAPAEEPAGAKAKPKRRRRRRRKSPAKEADQATEVKAAPDGAEPERIFGAGILDEKTTAAAETPPAGDNASAPPEAAKKPAKRRRRRRKPAAATPAEAEAAETPPAKAEAPAAPDGKPKKRRRRGRGGRKGPEKLMLMNAIDPGEVRVAVVEDGSLGEIYLERTKQHLIAGNIYRAKVTSVARKLQAAFVDLGVGKDAFLHASDTMPPDGGSAEILKDKKPKKRSKRLYKIEDMVKKGQDLLVQVTKEGIGQKGPAVTTYHSIPGRFLVLMPGLGRLGVSKKIQDDKERDDLKKMLKSLSPPDDLGFIIRTAGLGRSEEELQSDLVYLMGLWEALKDRAKAAEPPAVIYQESDLVIRAVRDAFTEDTSKIIVDSKEVYERVRDFVKSVMPGELAKVELYSSDEPIFHKHNVEEQLLRLLGRRVELPGGGSLVIEQTEALVAIDVNSGKGKGAKSSRDLILKTNLEAVKEVARQLRLRDIGGLVMIDLIDMDDLPDRKKVEGALKDALAGDKARVRVAPISEFGIAEMTRQRVREGLQRSLFGPCPVCGGTGMLKTAESVGLDCLREVKAALGNGAGRVELTLNPEVALYVANRYRNNMMQLEGRHKAEIILKGDPNLGAGDMAVRTLPGGERE